MGIWISTRQHLGYFVLVFVFFITRNTTAEIRSQIFSGGNFHSSGSEAFLERKRAPMRQRRGFYKFGFCVYYIWYIRGYAGRLVSAKSHVPMMGVA